MHRFGAAGTVARRFAFSKMAAGKRVVPIMTVIATARRSRAIPAEVRSIVIPYWAMMREISARRRRTAANPRTGR